MEKDVKMLKKTILTSEQPAKHVITGQNTQHMVLTYNTGHVSSNFDSILNCRFCDVTEPFDAVVDGAVDVLAAERLRGSSENGNLFSSGLHCRF